MTDLPPGWAAVTLGDLIAHDGKFADGDWVESKDQDPEGEVRLVQLADIGDGVFRNRSNRSMTLEKANELNCTFLERGDVLVARMPEPLGRACIYPGETRRAVTVVDVCILRPGSQGVSSRWLMWEINTPQVREQIRKYETGTTRKRISRNNLAKVELMVPPLGEQQRIVAALEEHLSRLDVAHRSLREMGRRGMVMHGSLLNAAVSGALAAQTHGDVDSWLTSIKNGRNELNSKAKKPASPVEIPGYKLPSGWRMESLDALSYHSSYGTSVKCDYEANGVPVLRIPNIRNGEIDLSDMKFTASPSVDLSDMYIAPGDILFVRTNGSKDLIGRASVVRESMNVAFASYLIRFRLASKRMPVDWIKIVVNSPLWRRYLESRAASSAGQYNLSIGVLAPLAIPIPPQSELDRILRVVDRGATTVSSLVNDGALALKRSDNLRRTLLAEAFAGRLVPQDPADEPASELLARIKAERAAQPKPQRARRTKPKESQAASPAESPAASRTAWPDASRTPTTYEQGELL
ncbi:restriction endonuclease subunit S [Streptosporangium canum]|uniref:restriction endonuclease subunit S n=1 Tax=Streptosporangium canum TaxID=324952 RepID=UPI0034252CC4